MAKVNADDFITQKRLIGELKNLDKCRQSYYQVIQDTTDIFKFYFCLKGDPKDDPKCDYTGGYYIGKIVLPKDYPNNPGEFYMLTPSGRFKVDSKICLTNTSYHKENWTPIWNLENMTVGFYSIFSADVDTGISHIKDSPAERRRMAKESYDYNMKYNPDIFKRFDQFIKPDGSLRTVEEINQFVEALKPKKKEPKLVKVTRTQEPVNVIKSSIAEPKPLEKQAEPKPLEKQAEPIPLEKSAEPIPLEKSAEPIPLEKQSEPIPLEKPTNPQYVEKMMEKNDKSEKQSKEATKKTKDVVVKKKQSKPENYDQWLEYVKNSTIDTFDYEIFRMYSD